MKTILKSGLFLLVFTTVMSTHIQSRETVTIASGGVAGVYFPTAVAICKLMHRSNYTNTRCKPSSTAGSIYNIDQLRNQTFDFALAQSDSQYMAISGDSSFKDHSPYVQLRSVMSLYSEPYTVLVKNNSDYQSFNDLKGSRVNFGSAGTGQHSTSKLLLELSGWTEADLKHAKTLPSDRQSRALCSGKIDAMIYIVGHPSDAVNEAIKLCGARLLPIEEVTVNRLINKYPFYKEVTIPGNSYQNNKKDITTFGVAATLLTDSKVSDDIVYHLVDAIFENLAIFKKLHPALGLLEPSEMTSDALTAPMHPGAKKYYQEKGS